MAQSRILSLVEATINTVAGAVLSMASIAYIFPIFGVVMSIRESAIATGVMMAVAIARQYLIRRIFNTIESREGCGSGTGWVRIHFR